MSFFATEVVDEWGTSYSLTTAGYVTLVVATLAIFLIGCAIFGKDKKIGAKQIAFSAMAIALAFVTSFLKIIDMPMGGSVTLLSMFFITLIGYWYGLGAGITCAVSYGLLQLIADPYIISVPQMLIDYLCAFGALGLSGIFHKSESKYKLLYCYLIGVVGRYFFAFLSGWIFFATYTPEFFNSAVVYSLAYNGAYIGLEALITVVIICLPPVRKAVAAVSPNK